MRRLLLTSGLRDVGAFLRANWRLWGLHAVLFAAIAYIALREFLTSSGVLLYQNFSWPISATGLHSIAGVWNPGFLTNVGPDPEGFARSVSNWPIFVFASLAPSPGFLERAFLIYVFLVTYVLTAVAAWLFTVYAGITCSGVKGIAAQLGFVGISFVNVASLQWQAGLAQPFLWGVPLIEIALFSTLLVLRARGPHFALLSGISLGWGATLDPRIFVWGFEGVLVLIVVYATYAGRLSLFRGLRRLLPWLAVGSAPGVALTLVAYSMAGAAGAHPITSASISSIQYFSSNSSPLVTLELLGYRWSSITYAPPSVAWLGSLSSMRTLGTSPYLLNPAGFVTALWVLSLATLPIVAYGSLLSQRYRRLVVPFACVSLFASMLAMGSQFPLPGLTEGEVALGSVPYVGSIWQTVIGVPVDVQALSEAALIPMCVLGTCRLAEIIAEIESRRTTAHVVRIGRIRVGILYRGSGSRRAGTALGVIAALLIVGLLTLSGWQLGTGSYFPAGYTPGLGGNDVPSVGVLSSETVPKGDVLIFNYLASQGVGDSVYWPGTGGYAYPWSNRSTPSISLNSPLPATTPIGLSNLIEQNDTAAITSLLNFYGIRYVVVNAMSGAALSSAFGATNVTQIVKALEAAPGLVPVLAFPPSAWLFEDTNITGSVSDGQTPITMVSGIQSVGIALGALSEVGVSAVGVPEDFSPHVSVSVGVQAAPTGQPAAEVLTPSNISASVMSGPSVVGFDGSPNVTLQSNFSSASTTPIPAPFSNWSLTSWTGQSGGGSIRVNAGSLVELSHQGSPATVSLNYLSPLVDGQDLGLPIDPRASVSVRLQFEYRTLPGFEGQLTSNVVASNASLIDVQQISGPQAGSSQNWTLYSANATLAPGAALFTARLFSTFTGSFEVRNFTMSWVEILANRESFSGEIVGLNGTSMSPQQLASFSLASVEIDLIGTGTLSLESRSGTERIPVKAPQLEWTRIDWNNSLRSVKFSGSISSGGIILSSFGALDGLAMASNFTVSWIKPFQYAYSVRSNSSTFLTLNGEGLGQWKITGTGSLTLAEQNQFGQTVFVVNPGQSEGRIFLNMPVSPPVIILGSIGAFALVLGVYTYLLLVRKGVIKRHKGIKS